MPILCLLVDPDNTICKGGFLFERYGDHSLTYSDAKKVCEETGSWLVRIKDDDVVDYVDDVIGIRGGSYYMGLNYEVNETKWKWNDETSLTTDQAKWYSDEGSASDNEYCACAEKNRKWIDVGCGTIQNYICQSEEDTAKTTNGYKLTWFTDNGTYGASETKCYEEGSWPVLIKDQAMQDEVQRILSCAPNDRIHFIIGLKCKDCSKPKSWFWSDETPLTYNNWASREGENGGEGCACIKKNGDWLDMPCSADTRALCQSELIMIRPTNSSVVVLEDENATFEMDITTHDGNLLVQGFKEPNTSVVFMPGFVGGKLSFSIETAKSSDAGNYTFVATPASGNYQRSTTIELDVHVRATVSNLEPPSIFAPPALDGPKTVTCTANGIPDPDAEWYRGDLNIPVDSTKTIYQEFGKIMATLHVQNADLNDAGMYTCRVMNFVGEKSIAATNERNIYLSVYGSPIILNSVSENCNEVGNVKVTWKPNTQTLNVNHNTTIFNLDTSSMVDSQTKVAENTTPIEVNFEGLASSTPHEIQVKVCPDRPDECITKLTVGVQITTGLGLPEAAVSAAIDQENIQDNCRITWEWNGSTPRNETTFIIVSTSWLNYIPGGYENISIYEEFSHCGSNDKFTLPTNPNRIYDVAVQATTCAGSAESVNAIGECRTDAAAPSSVPPPVTDSSVYSGSTRKITVNLPDETNGRISCIFVVVKIRDYSDITKEFDLSDLERVSIAATGENLDDESEYLALSILRTTIDGDAYETSLGDGSSSICNVIDDGESKSKRDGGGIDDNDFQAKNWGLKENVSYSYYTVTTTPTSDGDVAFQESDYVTFKNILSKPAVLVAAVVSSIVACLVIACAVAGSICIRRRRRKPERHEDQSNQQNDELYNETEYQVSFRNHRNEKLPKELEDHTYEVRMESQYE